MNNASGAKTPNGVQSTDFISYTTQTMEHISQSLNTSSTGLSEQEAQKRQALYGLNEVNQQTVSWWYIFKSQCLNPFFYTFCVIIIILLGMHEISNAIVIMCCLLINVIIGFYQEYKASRQLELLRVYLVTTNTVERDGKQIAVPSTMIVPGDIVILVAGDKIPADCRFIEETNLFVDESSLTGESVPVKKIATALASTPADIFAASNIGFSGTNVVSGTSRAIIFATGINTAFAKTATLTLQTFKESNLVQTTRSFGLFIIKLVVVSLVVTCLINLIKNKGAFNIADLFVFAIALAITAIPEALPAVVTFCLAQGAYELSKGKVIVKRLSAVEDLGAIEILCTDKTGTLTENSLSLAESYGDKNQTLLYALLCATGNSKEQLKTATGFEGALWQASDELIRTQLATYSIIDQIPFDFARRRNVVILKKDQQQQLVVRGSVDKVLPLCNVESKELSAIDPWTQEQEKKGNRVLAIAQKAFTLQSPTQDQIKGEEHDLTIVGLLSFIDPLKKTSFTAIQLAKKLGVNVKILSGDSKEVCGAVAYQMELIDSPDKVMSGSEFAQLSLPEKEKAIESYHVFARVLPEQKYEIVSMLERTYAVGYLGEGINDIPALKTATVSLVVQNAAALSQDVADIILLKKNLLAIVNGIKEGRKILANTFKYLLITISSSLGNFYSLAIASFFIPFLPMLPIQLLVVNLLSDLPMLAISTDTVQEEQLARPGLHSIQNILFISTVFGLVSSFFDFVVFALFKSQESLLHTAWFVSSLATELIVIFSLRTRTWFFLPPLASLPLIILSCIVLGITVFLPQLYLGQQWLQLIALTTTNFFVIALVVLCYFVTIEIIKLLYFKGYAKKNTPFYKGTVK